ncbi:MAG: peroxidase [Actinobacteria bacterium]|nr:peroxidase [Actinomycetota bacterium]
MVTDLVDRTIGWDRLPTPLAVLELAGLRRTLRRENLFDVDGVRLPAGPRPHGPDDRSLVRSADGSGNDVTMPEMGSAGSRFGRNIPPAEAVPRDVLEPNPRTVSLELLTREEFIPATTLNVIAAAWLQFEVHDWFSHPSLAETWDVELDEDDSWPEKPMRIPRAKGEPTLDGGPPTYRNTDSHWWDGSQVYGNTLDFQKKVRAEDGSGKLRLSETGVLPFDPVKEFGPEATAGWWTGLAMLNTLFMKEHNAICDHLAAAYPQWTGEEVFEHARLVNAALMAKIHTVEWTPALLGHPALQIGMRANWWGLLGERFARRFGRVSSLEEISGIPGSETDHHGVPFALTEEFVAVYRMHPLIPDDYAVRSAADDSLIGNRTFSELTGSRADEVIHSVPMADLFYTFGRANPGAIVLHNYPKHLQYFTKPDGSIMDLAVVDILRNRERGVPRYNEFRRKFRLAPATRFEDFSDDPQIVADLRRIYDDPEDVDLMIGLYAEKPPKGFAFSDTAFRVFVLMASRRLESDRFFTYDYRPEVYTPEGLRWVADNGMKSVLLRHYPQLAPALAGVGNAFAPWRPASA